jgi:hypothetical protein
MDRGIPTAKVMRRVPKELLALCTPALNPHSPLPAGIRRVPKEFFSFMRRKRAEFFMNMATSLAACVVTTCVCGSHFCTSFHNTTLMCIAFIHHLGAFTLLVPWTWPPSTGFTATPPHSPAAHPPQHRPLVVCGRVRCCQRQLRCWRYAQTLSPTEIAPPLPHFLILFNILRRDAPTRNHFIMRLTPPEGWVLILRNLQAEKVNEL